MNPPVLRCKDKSRTNIYLMINVIRKVLPCNQTWRSKAERKKVEDDISSFCARDARGRGTTTGGTPTGQQVGGELASEKGEKRVRKFGAPEQNTGCLICLPCAQIRLGVALLPAYLAFTYLIDHEGYGMCPLHSN